MRNSNKKVNNSFIQVNTNKLANFVGNIVYFSLVKEGIL